MNLHTITEFGKHCCRFGLLALLSSAAIAHEPGPHVHGIAGLQVAIDGGATSS